MTLKTLQELREAVPSRPFEIESADGRCLPLVTADHLFFMPNGKQLLVVLPDNGFRFVDLAQVLSAGRSWPAQPQCIPSTTGSQSRHSHA